MEGVPLTPHLPPRQRALQEASLRAARWHWLVAPNVPFQQPRRAGLAWEVPADGCGEALKAEEEGIVPSVYGVPYE